jgi:hypothetical protein
MIYRKRLTIDVYDVNWRVGPGSAEERERTRLATLPEDCAVLPGQLWRRFAFFPGGAFGFADRDHELGLLTG